MFSFGHHNQTELLTQVSALAVFNSNINLSLQKSIIHMDLNWVWNYYDICNCGGQLWLLELGFQRRKIASIKTHNGCDNYFSSHSSLTSWNNHSNSVIFPNSFFYLPFRTRVKTVYQLSKPVISELLKYWWNSFCSSLSNSQTDLNPWLVVSNSSDRGWFTDLISPILEVEPRTVISYKA